MTDIEIGAEVFAEIATHIGAAIDKAADAFLTRQRAEFNYHAIPISRTSSGVAVANTPLVISCGGPAKGRFLEITAITVVGSDDHTVLTGTNVAFYVGVTSLANLKDLVLPGSQGGSAVTVPSNAQFGRRQIIAQSPERAYFIIYGLTAGQQITATVIGWDRDVLEYPVGN